MHFRNDWCNLKSSINPCEKLTGRPYGGLGFICKKIPGVSYKSVLCESDRLCGVEIIASQKPVLTEFGAYLPHDSHKGGMELYLETLHELQGLIDKCGTSPYMVLGDFNTQLPMAKTLGPRWYKSGSFNRRSRLLYDFLSDNELYVANFSFAQDVNYTFKNTTSRSYIDHIMIMESLAEKVLNCKIQSDDDNVSDHLPLCCHIKLSIKRNMSNHNTTIDKANVNWSDHNVQKAYSDKLRSVLRSKPLPSMDQVLSTEEAEKSVNSVYSDICAAMTKASDAVANRKKDTAGPKRKHWWTTDCMASRDRLRLYYHIWRLLRRPTSGQAYLCYRLARKQYRWTCRRAVNSGFLMRCS
jgi:exonuclease III